MISRTGFSTVPRSRAGVRRALLRLSPAPEGGKAWIPTSPRAARSALNQLCPKAGCLPVPEEPCQRLAFGEDQVIDAEQGEGRAVQREQRPAAHVDAEPGAQVRAGDTPDREREDQAPVDVP